MEKRICIGILISLVFLFSCSSRKAIVRFIEQRMLLTEENPSFPMATDPFSCYPFVLSWPPDVEKKMTFHSEIAMPPAVAYGIQIVTRKDGKIQFHESATWKKMGEWKLFYGGEHAATVVGDWIIIPNALGNFSVRVIDIRKMAEVSRLNDIAAVTGVVTDGSLVVFVDVRNDVRCYHIRTGQLVWKVSAGESTRITPVRDGSWLYVLTDRGKLIKLEWYSGKIEATARFDGTFQASPLVFGDEVLLTSVHGKWVRVRREDLQAVISRPGMPPVVVTPALSPDNGVLICGTLDRTIVAVNYHTLGVKWEYPVEGIITARPVILGNVVWIGSWDGNLYVLTLEGNLVHRITLKYPIRHSISVWKNGMIVQAGEGRIFLYQWKH